MITLLTTTGCRPQAWQLCQQWMLRQTYSGPVHWIIVDDGEEAQKVTFFRAGWDITIIRPEPFWSTGKNTQCRNLLAGLEYVYKDTRLVIIEDDDWYSHEWLSVVDQELDKAELVGQGWNRYYNVVTSEMHMHENPNHASLCATALRGNAINLMRRVCERAPKLVDMQLWQHHNNKRIIKGSYVIGMKGLPGRPGIASGHKPANKPTGDLADWIGEDAKYYDDFKS